MRRHTKLSEKGLDRDFKSPSISWLESVISANSHSGIRFTSEASSAFRNKIEDFTFLLRDECRNVSKRHRSEEVVKPFVEEAAMNIVSKSSSKVSRLLGLLGGALLGAAGSTYLSLLQAGQYNDYVVGVCLAFVALGSFMAFAHYLKG